MQRHFQTPLISIERIFSVLAEYEMSFWRVEACYCCEIDGEEKRAQVCWYLLRIVNGSKYDGLYGWNMKQLQEDVHII